MVEQAHRRTKSILAQMLVLRGSRDFASEYQHWVREVAPPAADLKDAKALLDELHR